MIGNTFDKKKVSYGHARKVWREVRQVYPGGGVISNIADFVDAGVIKSGLPAKIDLSTKAVTVYPIEAIKNAGQFKNGNSGDKWPTLAEMGINGYIQEDVRVTSDTTIGTATVVYDGAIYEYMFDSEAVAALKGLTTTPMIVWVQ